MKLYPEAKEILIEARNLIADEDRWTQGIGSCSTDGEEVDFHSPDAVCWCALHAICRTAWNRKGPKVWDVPTTFIVEAANDKLAHAYKDDTDITLFNDTHSHQEVIDFLDSLIEEV